jgi:predicted Zn-dependent peptidase
MAMQINRRDAVKAFFSGVAAASVARAGPAHAVGSFSGPRSLCLTNGFRVHYIPNDSGYVAATLVLRSKEITHNGLAHICEHTSCVGAAGSMAAAEVARMNKDYVQNGNASTESGMLKWHASFLPQYLPQVTALLAATALDQKFDLETVEAQARVVLEELYLDQYDPDRLAQCKFDRELFGHSHPYVKETLPEEIALCKIPPATLAAKLRAFAGTVRLPANMDLFLVGSIEPDAVGKLANEHFGRFAFAEGPRLEVPRVPVTRAYRALTEPSYELQRPMSDLKIAWSTGACVSSDSARVLLALGEYLNTALFDELREKDGDTYTPDVKYEPDACSGIFSINISSSKDPQRVEKKVFDVIDRVKSHIDEKELARLRDRIELRRRKDAHSNEALLDGLVEKTLHGAAVDDLPVETVTREEMLAAARQYIPSHRQAYVRLALKGQ